MKFRMTPEKPQTEDDALCDRCARVPCKVVAFRFAKFRDTGLHRLCYLCVKEIEGVISEAVE